MKVCAVAGVSVRIEASRRRVSRRPATSVSRPVWSRIAPSAIGSDVPSPASAAEQARHGPRTRPTRTRSACRGGTAGGRGRAAAASSRRRRPTPPRRAPARSGGAVDPGPGSSGVPASTRSRRSAISSGASARSAPATTRRRSMPSSLRPAMSMWPPSAPSSRTDAPEQQVLAVPLRRGSAASRRRGRWERRSARSRSGSCPRRRGPARHIPSRRSAGTPIAGGRPGRR